MSMVRPPWRTSHAHPLPVVRRSRGHRIQIRRLGAGRLPRGSSERGRCDLGAFCLLPPESEGQDGRALGSHRRLPALVQPGARHHDPRNHPVMSRLASGGRIDRTRPLSFRFNGAAYQGYAGDTLASALLANDVAAIARSVTYGRPRGIFSAGVEEPNALVQVGSETMLRATQVELVEGLEATGLNGRGRLTLDFPSPARGGGQGGGSPDSPSPSGGGPGGGFYAQIYPH